jgi:hypothetical protein
LELHGEETSRSYGIELESKGNHYLYLTQYSPTTIGKLKASAEVLEREEGK